MPKLTHKKADEMYLSATSLKRFVKLHCGEFIGGGLYRDVYVLKNYPGYVAKIERDMETGVFANVTEWRNWCNNKEWTFLSQWLAPCFTINTTGTILIQKRVGWEGRRRKDYPTHVPAVFTDLKLGNFGWLGDQFVCCDYSFMIMTSKKIKYAKWWGEMMNRKN